jgi:hypothetical protein
MSEREYRDTGRLRGDDVDVDDVDDVDLGDVDLGDVHLGNADAEDVDERRGLHAAGAGGPGADWPGANGPRVNGAGAVGPAPARTAKAGEPAFDRDEAVGQWRKIQAEFVDQPRRAVQEADDLVSGLLDRLTAALTSECRDVEAKWVQNDQVSTEDLRMSLQRYRSIFERVIAV